MKKTARISSYILLSLLAIIALALLLLRLPSVQTFIAKKAMTVISEKTGAQISIGKVAIRFLDNIRIDEIYIEDISSDTLLYAGRLQIDINLFGLIKKEASIDKIFLENAFVNLKENTEDSTFNFQFLIDAFAGKPDTAAIDTTPSPWTFFINAAELKNVRANINAQVSGFLLNGSITNFSVNTEIFDLQKQELAFNNIILQNTDLQFELLPHDTNVIERIAEDTTADDDVFFIPDIGWKLRAKDIDFSDNTIKFDDSGKSPVEKGIDYAHLDLHDLDLKILDFSYEVQTINGVIDNLSTLEKRSAFQLKHLQGNVLLSPTGIVVENFSAETNKSKIVNSTQLQYPDFNAVIKLSDDLKVNSVFDGTHLALSDLLVFFPQLENGSFDLQAIDSVFIDGRVSGNIHDLSGKKFHFRVDEHSALQLNFHAKGLPDVDKANFVLNIEELTTSPAVVSDIANIELPKEVLMLGETTVRGRYKGTIRNFIFDGNIASQLGVLKAHLKAAFDEKYQHASYQGNINISNFEIGAMLEDTSIGKISLEAAITGSGLNFNDLHADLEATIREFGYRNYIYNDIKIDGLVDRKKFTGNFNINDENLKLDFAGMMNLNDTLPQFQFTATLDTLNLHALNLFADTLGLSAELSSDFNGANIDNFDGRASIKDIHLTSGSKNLKLDSIVARTETVDGSNKIIEVNSPVFFASIEGDFNVAQLPKLLMNYVNDYFPIDQKLDTTDAPPSLAIEPGPSNPPADQEFKFLFTISNPIELSQIFLPELTKLDTASISGLFDSKQKNLQLNGVIPGLQYSNMEFDSIVLAATGDNSQLTASVTTLGFNYNDKMQIPRATLTSKMFNNSMALNATLGNDSITKLGVAAIVTRPQNNYRVTLEDSLIINGERWSVLEGNYLEYNTGFLVAHNVNLSNGSQKIKVDSEDESGDAPVHFTFDNFRLHELSQLVDYDSINIQGALNGDLTLKNIQENLAFSANINIDTISVNKYPVGDLTLKAIQQSELIDIDLKITGGENNLLAAGNFNPSTSSMALQVNMTRLNLEILDPFLADFIKESKGFLTADITVSGKYTDPSVDGTLKLNDISTHVIYANTRFSFPDHTINIAPDRININRLQMFDANQRKAVLEGYLTHKNFSDFNIDLTFNTDEFLFMNSTEKESNFFYGKILLGINARITGGFDLPSIDVTAEAKAGTKVFANPMVSEQSAKQEDFVIFASPPFTEIENGDTLLVSQQYQVNISGVDLNLIFELTPEAEIQIVIDPIGGDALICRGTANLIVDIPPAGNIQITGTYIVEEGSYSFNYQKLFKRSFIIQKGSRIDFSGDPMNARLNITAIYTTETTTYELIANQSVALSETERSASRSRSPVEVLLNVKGELTDPILTFDIRLPADQSSVVSSTVARRLAQIRQDPTELNKQVFSLLMFNSFMTDQSGGNASASSTGENIALKSVSNLVSTQLNRLVNRVEGFEINLDVDSYKAKYETEAGNDMITEVELDISKQLFNERLEITVGGNVLVENSTGSQASQGGFSNITGDFIVEYKLSESGRYRIKVFQTSDYDLLNQSNLYRTGVGFTYRESFRNLLKRQEERRKKNAN